MERILAGGCISEIRNKFGFLCAAKKFV